MTSAQSPENDWAAHDWVVLGRITSLYGVKGWVKLHSYTDPVDNILDYDPLYIQSAGDWRELMLVASREHGKSLVIKIDGVDDRDAALAFLSRNVAVPRVQLPALDEGEYYWADLENLQVVNLQGEELGRIDRLFDTGANDVMVVRGEREYLIPFIREQVVREIDLSAQRMVVDWDADF